MDSWPHLWSHSFWLWEPFLNMFYWGLDLRLHTALCKIICKDDGNVISSICRDIISHMTDWAGNNLRHPDRGETLESVQPHESLLRVSPVHQQVAAEAQWKTPRLCSLSEFLLLHREVISAFSLRGAIDHVYSCLNIHRSQTQEVIWSSVLKLTNNDPRLRTTLLWESWKVMKGIRNAAEALRASTNNSPACIFSLWETQRVNLRDIFWLVHQEVTLRGIRSRLTWVMFEIASAALLTIRERAAAPGAGNNIICVWSLAAGREW